MYFITLNKDQMWPLISFELQELKVDSKERGLAEDCQKHFQVSKNVSAKTF